MWLKEVGFKDLKGGGCGMILEALMASFWL